MNTAEKCPVDPRANKECDPTRQSKSNERSQFKRDAQAYLQHVLTYTNVHIYILYIYISHGTVLSHKHNVCYTFCALVIVVAMSGAELLPSSYIVDRKSVAL